MRRCERFAKIENRRETAINASKAFVCLIERHRCKQRSDVGCQRRLRHRLGLAEGPIIAIRGVTKISPELRLDSPQHHMPTIGGCIDLIISRAAVKIVGSRFRHCAIGRPVGNLQQLERHQRVSEANIDVDTAPRAVPTVERAKNCDRREEGARHIGERWIKEHRRWRAVAVHHASVRKIIPVMRGRISERPCRTITTDRAIDEFGPSLLQRIIIEAEALHHARTKPFDQHISAVDMIEQSGAA